MPPRRNRIDDDDDDQNHKNKHTINVEAYLSSLTFSAAKEFDPQGTIWTPFSWVNSDEASNDRFVIEPVSYNAVSIRITLEILLR